MFSQFKARPQMIELVRNLKARYGLKVVAVSNEGWEMAVHRIEKFSLKTFVDFFSSRASSTAGSRTRQFTRWPWTSRRCRRKRSCVLKTSPCSWRPRRVWGFMPFQHLNYKYHADWPGRRGAYLNRRGVEVEQASDNGGNDETADSLEIHGNWPALEAVLAAEPERDSVVFCGDVVDYGPQPVECLRWLMGNAGHVVRGNHDNALGL